MHSTAPSWHRERYWCVRVPLSLHCPPRRDESHCITNFVQVNIIWTHPGVQERAARFAKMSNFLAWCSSLRVDVDGVQRLARV